MDPMFISMFPVLTEFCLFRCLPVFLYYILSDVAVCLTRWWKCCVPNKEAGVFWVPTVFTDNSEPANSQFLIKLTKPTLKAPCSSHIQSSTLFFVSKFQVPSVSWAGLNVNLSGGEGGGGELGFKKKMIMIYIQKELVNLYSVCSITMKNNFALPVVYRV